MLSNRLRQHGVRQAKNVSLGAFTTLAFGNALLCVWFVGLIVKRDAAERAPSGRTGIAAIVTIPEGDEAPPLLPAPGQLVRFHHKMYHWRKDCPITRHCWRSATQPQQFTLTRAQAEAKGVRPCYYCSHPARFDELKGNPS